jgi:hypothetical protein
MKLIQRIRQLCGLDPKLTRQQLNVVMLKKTVKMAERGHAEIWTAGYKTLERALADQDNHVFLLVINGRYIPKPKPLEDWFEEQVTKARLEITNETE